MTFSIYQDGERLKTLKSPEDVVEWCQERGDLSEFSICYTVRDNWEYIAADIFERRVCRT